MLVIQDKLVSEDLLKNHFVCNLKACKGACCWEGDWGAPLETNEIKALEEAREVLRPHLTEAGNTAIDQHGTSVFYKDLDKHGTPLIENGACAYLTFDDSGIARCGIEQANEDGLISFEKPISCHLYPIRYEEGPKGFKALNYDRWDICSAACQLGKQLKVPIFQFVKEALIRKFGQAFFNELEEVSDDLHQVSDAY